VSAIENYAIDHVVAILGEQPDARNKRYDWARGDAGTRLPFDAVWESRRLIVEVDGGSTAGLSHTSTRQMSLTVSGVHRGGQRRLYDDRKRTAAREQGYTVVVIPINGTAASRERNSSLRVSDRLKIVGILREAGVLHSAPA
jgi:hypothetical protein